MKRIIKLIALLLLFSFIIQSCVVIASNETDPFSYFTQVAMDEFTQQRNFLEAIGIIENDDDYDITSFITRLQFAKLVIKLINQHDTAEVLSKTITISDLIDVPNGEYGQYAVNTGLMNTVSHNIFGADDVLTYDQALKVFVNILGYEHIAAENGGYPLGYLVTANRIRLLDNVDYYSKYPIVYGSLLKLVSNALNIDFMGREVNTDNYQILQGHTILSDNLKLKKLSGIVQGVAHTNLIRERVAQKNKIEINDTIYFVNDDYSHLLGFNVDFYIRTETDDNIIIYIMPNKKNDLLTIKSKQIISYKNREYTYEIGNLKNTVSIPSNCYVIYNNSAISSPGNEDFIPKNGYIELLDNNDDNEYEVLKIINYSHSIVERIDKTNMVIYDKYDASKKLDLDTKSCEILDVYDSNLKKSDFSKIAVGDVLSIIKSKNGKIITLIISKAGIKEGTIDTIETDVYDYVTISDQRYMIAPDYLEGDDIEPGLYGTFLLDAAGNIVSFTKHDIEDYFFGYLIKAQLPNEGDLSKGLGLKIYSEKGEMIVAYTLKKIIFDGKTLKGKEQIYTALQKGYTDVPGQIIRYKLTTNGDIDEIYSAYNDYNGKTISDFPDKPNNLRLISDKAQAGLMTEQMTLGGKIGIGDSTIVFSIPTNNDASDNDYGILSSLNTKKSYNYTAYSKSDNNIESDVLVVYDASSLDEQYGVITSMKYTLDKEMSPVTEIVVMLYLSTKLTVYSYDGIEKQAQGGNNDGKTYALDVGDVISFSTKNGKLDKATLLCDASESGFDRVKFTNPSGHYTDTKYRYSYGVAHETTPKFLSLALTSPQSSPFSTELYIKKGFFIFVCDMQKSKYTVSAVTYGDYSTIMDYKRYGKDADDIFILLNYGGPRIMVIYKH